MIFNKIFFLIFCFHNAKSQFTFETHSTAGITTLVATTKATFGPLSTLSTTTKTTTVKPLVLQVCSTNICVNGAQCFTLNGIDAICSCSIGFTGNNYYYRKNEIINKD